MTLSASAGRALKGAIPDHSTIEEIRALLDLVSTHFVDDSATQLACSSVFKPEAADGADAAGAILVGVGTSADPASDDTAGGKFVELRCQTEATSGDNRLAYFRYAMDGANATGGGECLRAFTSMGAACGNAHGAHLSLSVSDTGYITGLGVGVRGQLYLADAAVPANGTYYGMQAEIYCEGDASDISGVTEHAILAVQATGDATGVAKVLNAIAFTGGADSGGGQMISPGTSMGEVEGTIRVLINGTPKYIPYYGHEGHA